MARLAGQLELHGSEALAGRKPGRKPKLDAKDRRIAELEKRAARLEVLVETDPLVGRFVNILLGRPVTDDDIAPPVEPLPPAVEARVQAMTPEQRESFLALVGSGMVDSMVGAFHRRFARMDADRNLPRETDEHEDFDYAITSIGESAMYRFLNHMPEHAVTDRAACEADLVRILRLLTASMFAGIVSVLVTLGWSGKTPSGGRYLRATFAAQRVLALRQDERIFSTYYLRREETQDAAEALGMPVAEEQERHRAFLDRVASVVEAMAEQFEQGGRGAYKAGEAFGDLLALLRRGEAPAPSDAGSRVALAVRVGARRDLRRRWPPRAEALGERPGGGIGLSTVPPTHPFGTTRRTSWGARRGMGPFVLRPGLAQLNLTERRATSSYPSSSRSAIDLGPARLTARCPCSDRAPREQGRSRPGCASRDDPAAPPAGWPPR